jgi:uncharacterized membrane protein
MFKVLLFVHILSAIVALGPQFSIPIMATWIQKHEPGGNEFLMKVSKVLGTRQILPAIVLLGLSGLGMILTVDIPITQFWLAAGIILYVIAFLLGFFVQRPTGERMIRIAQGDVEGMNIPNGNAFPVLMKEIKKTRIVGAVLLILFLVILGLMVFKPTF